MMHFSKYTTISQKLGLHLSPAEKVGMHLLNFISQKEIISVTEEPKFVS
jgi:hypothetical protein